jgi:hypothetical protein
MKEEKNERGKKRKLTTVSNGLDPTILKLFVW